MEVHGLAARGSDWDGFLHQIGAVRGIHAEAFDIDFLPPFGCEPAKVLADVVRATREAGGQRLLSLGHREYSTGEALAVTLSGAAGSIVVLDLFRAGDFVEHIKPQGTPTDSGLLVSIRPNDARPGPRVLTALVSTTPLDLGARPATEATGPYLAVLSRALRTVTDVRADMAGFELKPVAARVNAPPATVAAPSRCGAIMVRTQLGETLSDDDRAYLRAQCR